MSDSYFNPSESEKKLNDAQKKEIAQKGASDESFKLFGHLPLALQPLLNLQDSLFTAEGPLPPVVRIKIALTVASENDNSFSETFYTQALTAKGGSSEDTPKEKAIKELSKLVSNTPDKISDKTYEYLESFGWSKDEIFHAIVIASYCNFKDRLNFATGQH
eukprot:TRINITY_DN4067_c0_g3_i3.p1 TRINITY_DN4067_c0_g3~~TRINITY_DN4067_c0_g3_i3.p1  ORF type:complete len:161 (+),score=46.43 TRINITY_DN4067_c0_g3_i3:101-583(+)